MRWEDGEEGRRENTRETGGGERRKERRQGESGGGGEKNCLCACVREKERGEYGAVASLQAPHFCQQWHLYLLNALLMPRHVCCCKLLLRPILDVEEKRGRGGGRSAAVSPWVFFNGEEGDFWHQFVLFTLDHSFLPLLPFLSCFLTFFSFIYHFIPSLPPLHPPLLYLLSSFAYLYFTRVALFPTPPCLLPSLHHMYPSITCPTCL